MKILEIIPALISVASASCYDGNNFGCSHYCSASVCSCPSCWTLGEDGKTCEFEAGKAQVTCSATGAEIAIDKCALTGVDASLIHLKDTACAATEVDADTWKIATGFSDCGSEFGFTADKLTLKNTLTIGHSVVTGRVIGRKYEIDFSCSYNNIAEASTTIQASNVLYRDITFDLNDVQPAELSFEFGLNFYESADYTSQADLTTGAFQPGTSLFGKISPTSALADSLEFSVGKCTVEDTNIAQSLDILDTCPVAGSDFLFRDTQSDQSAVKFSFEGFVFPTSGDDTTIDVSCTVNICPANSLECLNLCEEVEGLLMIFDDLSKSIITNHYGSETSAVQANAPSNDYADRARSAVVQGKLHLFGGTTDRRKIARLDDCTFVELQYKLNFDFYNDHAALSISDNSEGLICFDLTNNKFCDVFTGSSVESTYSTAFTHRLAGLGFYNGQPITVGSHISDGYRKVETLSSTGWTSLADAPMNYHGHILVGVENDLLMIGGKDRDDGNAYKSVIWRLSNNNWSQETLSLKQKLEVGTGILFGKYIFIIGGHDGYGGYYSQRIDLDDNNEIAGVEQIGVLDQRYNYPALFVTSRNHCVSTL